MRVSFRIVLLLSCVALAGCSGSPSASWKTYRSDEFGASFAYPDTFVPGPVTDAQLWWSGTGVVVREATLTQSGALGRIHIARTEDPRVLAYLSFFHPLREEVIGGKQLWRFSRDSEGMPIGYVLREEPSFLVMTFDYPPSSEVLERILQSVVLFQEKKSSSSVAWKVFRSPELGVSLSYPDSFVPRSIHEADVAFGSETIHLRSVALVKGFGGETPMIVLDQTTNPLILKYLAVEHPLEDVSIGGKTLKRFREDGMGDPFGYILQTRSPFLIITFIGSSAEEDIPRILESISISPQ